MPKVTEDITPVKIVSTSSYSYKTSCYRYDTTYVYTIAYKCYISSLNKKDPTNLRQTECLHDKKIFFPKTFKHLSILPYDFQFEHCSVVPVHTNPF